MRCLKKIILYLPKQKPNQMKTLSLLSILTLSLFIGGSAFSQEMEQSSFEFSVYPNPTVSIINTTLDDFQYAIYDYTGEMVAYGLSEEPRIDVSGLNNGVYWLRVLGKEGEVGAIKFVKE